jgi:hypothetical protein
MGPLFRLKCQKSYKTGFKLGLKALDPGSGLDGVVRFLGTGTLGSSPDHPLGVTHDTLWEPLGSPWARFGRRGATRVAGALK